MNKIISCILLSIVLFSCEKDVSNILLPKTAPKLVVGCFLSANDTAVYASVTASNPVLGQTNTNGNGSAPLSNATVNLSNGTSSITLVFDPTKGTYKASTSLFPILPGASYSISVSAAGYDNVSASCVVPATKVVNSSASILNGSEQTTKVRVKWNDLVSEPNYYLVNVNYIIVDTISLDTAYSFNTQYQVFSDEGKDGSELYAEVDYLDKYGSIYDMPGISSPSSVVKGYQIEVSTLDVHYYKYQNAYNNNPGANPFAEPYPFYSNITNGLGVLGAKNAYKYSLF